MAGATLSKGLIGIVLPAGALVVVHGDHARFRDCGDAFALGSGLALFLVADRAVVHRGRARQRRVPALLLHPRAFPALPHDRASPLRSLVLLRPALRRRNPALADGARVRTAAAPGAKARRMRSGSRGSGSRSCGPRSSFCSSARRARSCRRTSCRCSRRSRSWSAGCSCGSTSGRSFRLTLPLAVVGCALALGLARRLRSSGAGLRRRAAGRRAVVVRRLGQGCGRGRRGRQRRRAARVPARERAAAGRFWGVAALSLVDARRAADRGRRIRRVQPNALDLGYPAGCASARPRLRTTPRSIRSPCTTRPLPFYLGRTTRLADFRDELALGIDAEPAKQVPTLDAWIAEWSALGAGLRAAAAGALPDARRHNGVPMRELARDSRRVIVSRQ